MNCTSCQRHRLMSSFISGLKTCASCLEKSEAKRKKRKLDRIHTSHEMTTLKTAIGAMQMRNSVLRVEYLLARQKAGDQAIIDVHSDANWAGCKRSRQSSSGGTIAVG